MIKTDNLNIICLTDSYKTSHKLQYPPGTEIIFSYFESRSDKSQNIVFFGLQYLLKRYFVGKILTERDIDEAEGLINKHMGRDIFERNDWEYILDEHKGMLPISIKAVPEGSIVSANNVLLTVENTDPRLWWLTNYVETLLVQLWYPCTIATRSYEIRKCMDKFAFETGDPSAVPFKLQDFGFRGVSSVESAGIGGLAHLLSFLGTDNIVALMIARNYYRGFRITKSRWSP